MAKDKSTVKTAICKCFCLLILLLFILAAYVIQNQINFYEENKLKFETIITNTSESLIPIKYALNSPCYHPVVFRNAIDINQMSNNKDCMQKDVCQDSMKNRIIAFFGNRTVNVKSFNNSQWGRNKTKYTFFTKAKNFFTDDKYMNHQINAFNQIGTVEQYEKFFANHFDYKSFRNDTKKNYGYLGLQAFIARGQNTGSAMHFAWGRNVVIQLGGQKRWVLAHPKYTNDFNCTIETRNGGVARDCYKDPHYRLKDMNIDENLYPVINEINATVYDITLNPGDILLNCDTWLHIIENITPDTMSFSVRFASKPMLLFYDMLLYSYEQWKILYGSLNAAIKKKIQNVIEQKSSLTLIDVMLFMGLTNGPYNMYDTKTNYEFEDENGVTQKFLFFHTYDKSKQQL